MSQPLGAAVILGAGPEQIQQANPLANYVAAALDTAVPNEVNYPVATETDIQQIPQVVNITSLKSAPAGVAAWPNPTVALATMDGSAPS